jgi:ABC-type multidrug transport system ATPase subunit
MRLTIKNLSKQYQNGVQALDQVSLNISTGMFGLLGPNGAGKSTLMRTIATLQEPDEGEIYLDDISVLEEKDKVKKVLGYLPQEFGVYPKISAESLLNHLAVLKGVARKPEREERVKSLLKHTNLYESRKKKLGTFSGGMKQRFGIAQALLGDPKLIIVDEPTAGLDPAERNRFLNLLSEIGEERVVILSTHIVADVKELCTDMAILNQGRVCLTQDPLEAMKQLEGKVWQKIVDKQQLPEYEQRYNLISTKLIAGQTEIHVLADSKPDSTFKSVSPDLEDVYFSTIFEDKQAATPS